MENNREPQEPELSISNQMLKGHEVKFIPSPNFSADFKYNLPDTIIIHYTAGPTLESAVSTFKNRLTKVSAHLIISREGRIIQMVPFDKIAWHAGKSTHNKRINLNNCSIGLELVNAGRLVKRDDDYYSWFNKKYEQKDVLPAVHRNEQKLTYWHRYTAMQISQTEKVCSLLKERYNISHILGHDEISPHRKTDPGPAFPIEQLRQKLLF